MRWPWRGIEQTLREQHERHELEYGRLIEEHRRFTTECIMDMRRYSERKDRELDARITELRERTDEVLAEQRAGRQALLRMLDRLGPASGET